MICNNRLIFYIFNLWIHLPCLSYLASAQKQLLTPGGHVRNHLSSMPISSAISHVWLYIIRVFPSLASASFTPCLRKSPYMSPSNSGLTSSSPHAKHLIGSFFSEADDDSELLAEFEPVSCCSFPFASLVSWIIATTKKFIFYDLIQNFYIRRGKFFHNSYGDWYISCLFKSIFSYLMISQSINSVLWVYFYQPLLNENCLTIRYVIVGT